MDANNIIINIGRQFGSGGKEIAMKVGEKLGINVYDNELISKAAEESGFSKELFERSDERRSMFNISSFFGAGRFGSAQNYVGDNELFKIKGLWIGQDLKKRRQRPGSNARTGHAKPTITSLPSVTGELLRTMTCASILQYSGSKVLQISSLISAGRLDLSDKNRTHAVRHLQEG